jgi:hypothetical protein
MKIPVRLIVVNRISKRGFLQFREREVCMVFQNPEEEKNSSEFFDSRQAS